MTLQKLMESDKFQAKIVNNLSMNQSLYLLIGAAIYCI